MRYLTCAGLFLFSAALGWSIISAREPRVPEAQITYRPVQVQEDGYVSSDTCKACHIAFPNEGVCLRHGVPDACIHRVRYLLSHRTKDSNDEQSFGELKAVIQAHRSFSEGRKRARSCPADVPKGDHIRTHHVSAVISTALRVVSRQIMSFDHPHAWIAGSISFARASASERATAPDDNGGL